MTGKRYFRFGLCSGLLVLALLLSLSGCERQPTAREFNETVYTFGTLVNVTLVGVDEAQAQTAYTAMLDDFTYMHQTWHAWQPNALARINGLLKTGVPFSLAPSILPLITQAQTLSAQSEGLFNPAIGQLINLWGFQTDSRDEHAPPPTPDEIAQWLRQPPSMDDIVIDGLNMRGLNPQLQLDFGGFAKGYAVDVAINHLRELGVENAIINAGGDLRAIGRHGQRPWRVGIRHPRKEGVFASLEIEGDESVFTSGDYERFFEYEGRRYHHIIDPRNGYPADQVRSVTVIHPDGATADAAATALFIAGPKDWHRIAKRMGIKYVMLIDKGGRVHMNPAMQQRLQFKYTPEVLLSEEL
ncbi:FAD:protein FMN transferase [Sulfuriflexus mobilis]|uniref:FAD:protein FMN transferase n=1 Tax=Sulfuriflexus mobilis TaxID=1811807 RepID=UPI000F82BD66|nr:FAD:protein FMN transferase [Sulfuriflexus mobilis]